MEVLLQKIAYTKKSYQLKYYLNTLIKKIEII